MSRGRGARLLALWALLLISGALVAQPRIGVVTMNPGLEYWARYGHNAIVVIDGDSAIAYNFGYFDFEQPGFLARFLRGDMRYLLLALPYAADIRGYAAEGRGVSVQWLNLRPEQAVALSRSLAVNALPENAEYRYDYYSANCSTKVRDALDSALGGELKRQTISRSHGLSFRSESLRLAGPLPWMALGIHFGLGPRTDQIMSRWEEAFVPARLAANLREVVIDGQPLVHSEIEVVPARLADAPDAPPRWLLGFVVASALLSVALAQTLAHASTWRRRLGTLVAGSLWLTLGLAGVGLTLLWLATDHQAAWANQNLLLASPLCLLMLAAVPDLWRGNTPRRWLTWLGVVVLVLAIGAVGISWLFPRSQQQLEWLILLLPAHAVMTWRLNSRALEGVAPATLHLR